MHFYPVVAKMPDLLPSLHDFLHECSLNCLFSVHREPYLFYIINTFMVFILICVLITAVMEAERILKVTIGAPMHARATHLLDLRRVAQEVDDDMRQRIVTGISTEDDLKLQSPTPKPIEKKLLLSRLASRSLNLLVMPFTLSLTFARKCLSAVKASFFVFRWKRREEAVEEPDNGEELSEDGDEIDLDELDEEDDDIEDGDDEGEEDQCSMQVQSLYNFWCNPKGHS